MRKSLLGLLIAVSLKYLFVESSETSFCWPYKLTRYDDYDDLIAINEYSQPTTHRTTTTKEKVTTPIVETSVILGKGTCYRKTDQLACLAKNFSATSINLACDTCNPNTEFCCWNANPPPEIPDPPRECPQQIKPPYVMEALTSTCGKAPLNPKAPKYCYMAQIGYLGKHANGSDHWMELGVAPAPRSQSHVGVIISDRLILTTSANGASKAEEIWDNPSQLAVKVNGKNFKVKTIHIQAAAAFTRKNHLVLLELFEIINLISDACSVCFGDLSTTIPMSNRPYWLFGPHNQTYTGKCELVGRKPELWHAPFTYHDCDKDFYGIDSTVWNLRSCQNELQVPPYGAAPYSDTAKKVKMELNEFCTGDPEWNYCMWDLGSALMCQDTSISKPRLVGLQFNSQCGFNYQFGALMEDVIDYEAIEWLKSINATGKCTDKTTPESSTQTTATAASTPVPTGTASTKPSETTRTSTGAPVPSGQTIVPTGPTTAPSVPTSAPTGPTTVPTGPSTAPTGPTTAPTGPSPAPTGPPTAPTGSSTAPTGPSTPPTGTAPTGSSTAPTGPSPAPTGPSTAPTGTAPTGPSIAPTYPSTAPTGPSTPPTGTAPTGPPTAPTGSSTAPTGSSTAPTGPSPAPTGPSTAPTGTAPTGPSIAPTYPSTAPTGPSTPPTGTAPTGPPTAPTGSSTAPTGPSPAPTGPSTAPTLPPTAPTGPSTAPTATAPSGSPTAPTGPTTASTAQTRSTPYPTLGPTGKTTTVPPKPECELVVQDRTSKEVHNLDSITLTTSDFGPVRDVVVLVWMQKSGTVRNPVPPTGSDLCQNYQFSVTKVNVSQTCSVEDVLKTNPILTMFGTVPSPQACAQQCYDGKSDMCGPFGYRLEAKPSVADAAREPDVFVPAEMRYWVRIDHQPRQPTPPPPVPKPKCVLGMADNHFKRLPAAGTITVKIPNSSPISTVFLAWMERAGSDRDMCEHYDFKNRFVRTVQRAADQCDVASRAEFTQEYDHYLVSTGENSCAKMCYEYGTCGPWEFEMEAIPPLAERTQFPNEYVPARQQYFVKFEINATSHSTTTARPTSFSTEETPISTTRLSTTSQGTNGTVPPTLTPKPSTPAPPVTPSVLPTESTTAKPTGTSPGPTSSKPTVAGSTTTIAPYTPRCILIQQDSDFGPVDHGDAVTIRIPDTGPQRTVVIRVWSVLAYFLNRMENRVSPAIDPCSNYTFTITKANDQKCSIDDLLSTSLKGAVFGTIPSPQACITQCYEGKEEMCGPFEYNLQAKPSPVDVAREPDVYVPLDMKYWVRFDYKPNVTPAPISLGKCTLAMSDNNFKRLPDGGTITVTIPERGLDPERTLIMVWMEHAGKDRDFCEHYNFKNRFLRLVKRDADSCRMAERADFLSEFDHYVLNVEEDSCATTCYEFGTCGPWELEIEATPPLAQSMKFPLDYVKDQNRYFVTFVKSGTSSTSPSPTLSTTAGRTTPRDNTTVSQTPSVSTLSTALPTTARLTTSSSSPTSTIVTLPSQYTTTSVIWTTSTILPETNKTVFPTSTSYPVTPTPSATTSTSATQSTPGGPPGTATSPKPVTDGSTTTPPLWSNKCTLWTSDQYFNVTHADDFSLADTITIRIPTTGPERTVVIRADMQKTCLHAKQRTQCGEYDPDYKIYCHREYTFTITKVNDSQKCTIEGILESYTNQTVFGTTPSAQACITQCYEGKNEMCGPFEYKVEAKPSAAAAAREPSVFVPEKKNFWVRFDYKPPGVTPSPIPHGKCTLAMSDNKFQRLPGGGTITATIPETGPEPSTIIKLWMERAGKDEDLCEHYNYKISFVTPGPPWDYFGCKLVERANFSSKYDHYVLNIYKKFDSCARWCSDYPGVDGRCGPFEFMIKATPPLAQSIQYPLDYVPDQKRFFVKFEVAGRSTASLFPTLPTTTGRSTPRDNTTVPQTPSISPSITTLPSTTLLTTFSSSSASTSIVTLPTQLTRTSATWMPTLSTFSPTFITSTTTLNPNACRMIIQKGYFELEDVDPKEPFLIEMEQGVGWTAEQLHITMASHAKVLSACPDYYYYINGTRYADNRPAPCQVALDNTDSSVRDGIMAIIAEQASDETPESCAQRCFSGETAACGPFRVQFTAIPERPSDTRVVGVETLTVVFKQPKPTTTQPPSTTRETTRPSPPSTPTTWSTAMTTTTLSLDRCKMVITRGWFNIVVISPSEPVVVKVHSDPWENEQLMIFMTQDGKICKNYHYSLNGTTYADKRPAQCKAVQQDIVTSVADGMVLTVGTDQPDSCARQCHDGVAASCGPFMIQLMTVPDGPSASRVVALETITVLFNKIPGGVPTPGPGGSTTTGGGPLTSPTPGPGGSTTGGSPTPGPGGSTTTGGGPLTSPSPSPGESTTTNGGVPTTSPGGSTTGGSPTPGPGGSTTTGGGPLTLPSPSPGESTTTNGGVPTTSPGGSTTGGSPTPGPGGSTTTGGGPLTSPTPGPGGSTTGGVPTPGPGGSTTTGGGPLTSPTPGPGGSTTGGVPTPGPGGSTTTGGGPLTSPSPSPGESTTTNGGVPTTSPGGSTTGGSPTPGPGGSTTTGGGPLTSPTPGPGGSTTGGVPTPGPGGSTTTGGGPLTSPSPSPGESTTTNGGVPTTSPGGSTTGGSPTPGPGGSTTTGGGPLTSPTPGPGGSTTGGVPTPGPDGSTTTGGGPLTSPTPGPGRSTTGGSPTPGPDGSTTTGGGPLISPTSGPGGSTTGGSPTPGPDGSTTTGGGPLTSPTPGPGGSTTGGGPTPGPGGSTTTGGGPLISPTPGPGGSTTGGSPTPGPGGSTTTGGGPLTSPSPSPGESTTTNGGVPTTSPGGSTTGGSPTPGPGGSTTTGGGPLTSPTPGPGGSTTGGVPTPGPGGSTTTGGGPLTSPTPGPGGSTTGGSPTPGPDGSTTTGGGPLISPTPGPGGSTTGGSPTPGPGGSTTTGGGPLTSPSPSYGESTTTNGGVPTTSPGGSTTGGSPTPGPGGSTTTGGGPLTSPTPGPGGSTTGGVPTPGPGGSTTTGGGPLTSPTPGPGGSTTGGSPTPGPDGSTTTGGGPLTSPTPGPGGSTTGGVPTPGPGGSTTTGGGPLTSPTPGPGGSTTGGSPTPGPDRSTTTGGGPLTSPSPSPGESTTTNGGIPTTSPGGSTTGGSPTPGPGESTTTGGGPLTSPTPSPGGSTTTNGGVPTTSPGENTTTGGGTMTPDCKPRLDTFGWPVTSVQSPTNGTLPLITVTMPPHGPGEGMPVFRIVMRRPDGEICHGYKYDFIQFRSLAQQCTRGTLTTLTETNGFEGGLFTTRGQVPVCADLCYEGVAEGCTRFSATVRILNPQYARQEIMVQYIGPSIPNPNPRPPPDLSGCEAQKLLEFYPHSKTGSVITVNTLPPPQERRKRIPVLHVAMIKPTSAFCTNYTYAMSAVTTNGCTLGDLWNLAPSRTGWEGATFLANKEDATSCLQQCLNGVQAACRDHQLTITATSPFAAPGTPPTTWTVTIHFNPFWTDPDLEPLFSVTSTAITVSGSPTAATGSSGQTVGTTGTGVPGSSTGVTVTGTSISTTGTFGSTSGLTGTGTSSIATETTSLSTTAIPPPEFFNCDTFLDPLGNNYTKYEPWSTGKADGLLTVTISSAGPMTDGIPLFIWSMRKMQDRKICPGFRFELSSISSSSGCELGSFVAGYPFSNRARMVSKSATLAGSCAERCYRGESQHCGPTTVSVINTAPYTAAPVRKLFDIAFRVPPPGQTSNLSACRLVIDGLDNNKTSNPLKVNVEIPPEGAGSGLTLFAVGVRNGTKGVYCDNYTFTTDSVVTNGGCTLGKMYDMELWPGVVYKVETNTGTDCATQCYNGVVSACGPHEVNITASPSSTSNGTSGQDSQQTIIVIFTPPSTTIAPIKTTSTSKSTASTGLPSTTTASTSSATPTTTALPTTSIGDASSTKTPTTSTGTPQPTPPPEWADCDSFLDPVGNNYTKYEPWSPGRSDGLVAINIPANGPPSDGIPLFIWSMRKMSNNQTLCPGFRFELGNSTATSGCELGSLFTGSPFTNRARMISKSLTLATSCAERCYRGELQHCGPVIISITGIPPYPAPPIKKLVEVTYRPPPTGPPPVPDVADCEMVVDTTDGNRTASNPSVLDVKLPPEGPGDGLVIFAAAMKNSSKGLYCPNYTFALDDVDTNDGCSLGHLYKSELWPGAFFEAQTNAVNDCATLCYEGRISSCGPHVVNITASPAPGVANGQEMEQSIIVTFIRPPVTVRPTKSTTTSKTTFPELSTLTISTSPSTSTAAPTTTRAAPPSSQTTTAATTSAASTTTTALPTTSTATTLPTTSTGGTSSTITLTTSTGAPQPTPPPEWSDCDSFLDPVGNNYTKYEPWSAGRPHGVVGVHIPANGPPSDGIPLFIWSIRKMSNNQTLCPGFRFELGNSTATSGCELGSLFSDSPFTDRARMTSKSPTLATSCAERCYRGESQYCGPVTVSIISTPPYPAPVIKKLVELTYRPPPPGPSPVPDVANCEMVVDTIDGNRTARNPSVLDVKIPPEGPGDGLVLFAAAMKNSTKGVYCPNYTYALDDVDTNGDCSLGHLYKTEFWPGAFFEAQTNAVNDCATQCYKGVISSCGPHQVNIIASPGPGVINGEEIEQSIVVTFIRPPVTIRPTKSTTTWKSSTTGVPTLSTSTSTTSYSASTSTLTTPPPTTSSSQTTTAVTTSAPTPTTTALPTTSTGDTSAKSTTTSTLQPTPPPEWSDCESYLDPVGNNYTKYEPWSASRPNGLLTVNIAASGPPNDGIPLFIWSMRKMSNNRTLCPGFRFELVSSTATSGCELGSLSAGSPFINRARMISKSLTLATSCAERCYRGESQHCGPTIISIVNTPPYPVPAVKKMVEVTYRPPPSGPPPVADFADCKMVVDTTDGNTTARNPLTIDVKIPPEGPDDDGFVLFTAGMRNTTKGVYCPNYTYTLDDVDTSDGCTLGSLYKPDLWPGVFFKAQSNAGNDCATQCYEGRTSSCGPHEVNITASPGPGVVNGEEMDQTIVVTFIRPPVTVRPTKSTSAISTTGPSTAASSSVSTFTSSTSRATTTSSSHFPSTTMTPSTTQSTERTSLSPATTTGISTVTTTTLPTTTPEPECLPNFDPQGNNYSVNPNAIPGGVNSRLIVNISAEPPEHGLPLFIWSMRKRGETICPGYQFKLSKTAAPSGCGLGSMVMGYPFKERARMTSNSLATSLSCAQRCFRGERQYCGPNTITIDIIPPDATPPFQRHTNITYYVPPPAEQNTNHSQCDLIVDPIGNTMTMGPPMTINVTMPVDRPDEFGVAVFFASMRNGSMGIHCLNYSYTPDSIKTIDGCNLGIYSRFQSWPGTAFSAQARNSSDCLVACNNAKGRGSSCGPHEIYFTAVAPKGIIGGSDKKQLIIVNFGRPAATGTSTISTGSPATTMGSTASTGMSTTTTTTVTTPRTTQTVITTTTPMTTTLTSTTTPTTTRTTPTVTTTTTSTTATTPVSTTITSTATTRSSTRPPTTADCVMDIQALEGGRIEFPSPGSAIFHYNHSSRRAPWPLNVTTTPIFLHIAMDTNRSSKACSPFTMEQMPFDHGCVPISRIISIDKQTDVGKIAAKVVGTDLSESTSCLAQCNTGKSTSCGPFSIDFKITTEVGVLHRLFQIHFDRPWSGTVATVNPYTTPSPPTTRPQTPAPPPPATPATNAPVTPNPYTPRPPPTLAPPPPPVWTPAPPPPPVWTPAPPVWTPAPPVWTPAPPVWTPAPPPPIIESTCQWTPSVSNTHYTVEGLAEKELFRFELPNPQGCAGYHFKVIPGPWTGDVNPNIPPAFDCMRITSSPPRRVFLPANNPCSWSCADSPFTCTTATYVLVAYYDIPQTHRVYTAQQFQVTYVAPVQTPGPIITPAPWRTPAPWVTPAPQATCTLDTTAMPNNAPVVIPSAYDEYIRVGVPFRLDPNQPNRDLFSITFNKATSPNCWTGQVSSEVTSFGALAMDRCQPLIHAAMEDYSRNGIRTYTSFFDKNSCMYKCYTGQRHHCGPHIVRFGFSTPARQIPKIIEISFDPPPGG